MAGLQQGPDAILVGRHGGDQPVSARHQGSRSGLAFRNWKVARPSIGDPDLLEISCDGGRLQHIRLDRWRLPGAWVSWDQQHRSWLTTRRPHGLRRQRAATGIAAPNGIASGAMAESHLLPSSAAAAQGFDARPGRAASHRRQAVRQHRPLVFERFGDRVVPPFVDALFEEDRAAPRRRG